MVSLAELQTTAGRGNFSRQYRCLTNLNLYDSPALEGLATQAAVGRYLRVTSLYWEQSRLEPSDRPPGAISVRLCEDDYPGWLAVGDLSHLEVAKSAYQAIPYPEPEIRLRVEQVIAFAKAAMAQPNHYLWGGTVAPHYDCSGLVQAAFASTDIWLPRDAYQQEAFVQTIASADLIAGDLVFFGPPVKATHVGIYLGGDRYIHSSGKDQGRNGIGIDSLAASEDPISQAYRAQLRGAGRIVAVYG